MGKVNNLILIDNYDSFTYNLVQYLKELGIEPEVFKNDEITVSELKKLKFSGIIISPGPKNPDGAGISLDVIKEFHKTKKILGVCLGHQCIAQYFGCKIVKAKDLGFEPMHGKTSKIYFEKDELFEGIEQGFEATRYHSLIVDNDSLTSEILPLAFAEGKGEEERGKGGLSLRGASETNDAAIQKENHSPFTIHHSPLMALKHKTYPVYGVQFHPEAILTQFGKRLLSNFLQNIQ